MPYPLDPHSVVRPGEYAPSLTVGSVEYDPQAIEDTRSQMQAPRDWAAMLAGPGALAARGARAVIGPGAAMRRRAMAEALRPKRAQEAILEGMFAP